MTQLGKVKFGIYWNWLISVSWLIISILHYLQNIYLTYRATQLSLLHSWLLLLEIFPGGSALDPKQIRFIIWFAIRSVYLLRLSLLSRRLHHLLCDKINIFLSQPQLQRQLNLTSTEVGFDTKMTLHTTPPRQQNQQHKQHQPHNNTTSKQWVVTSS